MPSEFSKTPPAIDTHAAGGATDEPATSPDKLVPTEGGDSADESEAQPS